MRTDLGGPVPVELDGAVRLEFCDGFKQNPVGDEFPSSGLQPMGMLDVLDMMSEGHGSIGMSSAPRPDVQRSPAPFVCTYRLGK